MCNDVNLEMSVASCGAISDFSSKNLTDLVGKLKDKGISEEDLREQARDLGLRSCSYGNFHSLYPLLGAAIGNILGAGASYLSNEFCLHFNANLASKIISDGICFISPLIFFTNSGFNVRKSQDYEFYYRIKKIFKDKLSS